MVGENKRGALGLDQDHERSGIAVKQIIGGNKDRSHIFQSVLWKALIKSLKHRLCPHCPLGLVSNRPSGKSTCLIYIFLYKFCVIIFPFVLKNSRKPFE